MAEKELCHILACMFSNAILPPNQGDPFCSPYIATTLYFFPYRPLRGIYGVLLAYSAKQGRVVYSSLTSPALGNKRQRREDRRKGKMREKECIRMEGDYYFNINNNPFLPALTFVQEESGTPLHFYCLNYNKTR